MRRLTTSLGSLAAGVLLALAVPAAGAHAADGVLIINGVQQTNPQGCITNSASPAVIQLLNLTDRAAVVYAMPDCQGAPVALVTPQNSATEMGSSVAMVD